MKELTEAKFPRTGKEYTLEKTTNGFNLRLIDLDDQLPAIPKTFNQLLELSRSGQIQFSGFEEKKNEAELILLNCSHEEKISSYELRIAELTTESANLKNEIEDLKTDSQKEIKGLKEENENLKEIIQGLKEANSAIVNVN